MKRPKTVERSIESIVRDVIGSLSGKGRLSEEEICGAWKAAAGEKAAGHTRPVSIRKSVLTVNVDSSGWLYELTIKKKDLIKKLEGKVRGKKIKSIKLRIGGIEESGREKGKSKK